MDRTQKAPVPLGFAALLPCNTRRSEQEFSSTRGPGSFASTTGNFLCTLMAHNSSALVLALEVGDEPPPEALRGVDGTQLRRSIQSVGRRPLEWAWISGAEKVRPFAKSGSGLVLAIGDRVGRAPLGDLVKLPEPPARDACMRQPRGGLGLRWSSRVKAGIGSGRCCPRRTSAMPPACEPVKATALMAG